MARGYEAQNLEIPAPPNTSVWRLFGDGYAGKMSAARIQGYDSGSLSYIDVAVDSSGVLQTAVSGGGGGSVTQGTSPWVVSAASLPLPTGAATDALQTTGNTSLSSINTKIPSNLTVTATRLLVDGSGVTQPVSGPLTDTQLRLTPVPVSGTVTTGGLTDTQLRASAVPVSLATLPALAAGSAVIGHVIVDTAPSTAVTNAGTFAVQASWAAAQHVIVDTAPSTAVTGPLTDTQLRASAVPVSLATAPTTAVTQSTSPWIVTDATATAVANTGTLPALTNVVAGYDGGFVRALKTDVNGALYVASQQGTQDDLLLELQKHTVALRLLLSQFTGEADLDWMVN